MGELCWPVVKIKKSLIAASKIMGSRPWFLESHGVISHMTNSRWATFLGGPL